MNPNYYSPNSCRNPYGSGTGSDARSPLIGGGSIFYRPSTSSPQHRPRNMNAGSVPGQYARHSNPYGWTPGSSSPASGISPSGSGFVQFMGNNSPRFRSPLEGGFDRFNSSTPFHGHGPNSGRGSFRFSRGSAKFSSNSRQSWSGSPGSFPGDSSGGNKRLNSGYKKYDCNPGGSSDIRLYYSPSMLSDPWSGLEPLSVGQNVANLSSSR